MATANHVDDNITVSGEAVDLLSCFVAELDSAIFSIAREVARERVGAGGAPLEITAEDVRTAVRIVLPNLRDKVAEGKLPNHMKEALNGFERCFEEKGEY